jgi:hypothetical protein
LGLLLAHRRRETVTMVVVRVWERIESEKRGHYVVAEISVRIASLKISGHQMCNFEIEFSYFSMELCNINPDVVERLIEWFLWAFGYL